jgi:hypothetical protein
LIRRLWKVCEADKSQILKNAMSPTDTLRRAQTKAKREAVELHMMQHLQAARLTDGIQREHRFDPARRWRFDFAWPARMVALEVEGGAWSGGRHTRGAGFTADIEKYNRAAVLGWTVIRATSAHVRSGKALSDVQQMLEAV